MFEISPALLERLAAGRRVAVATVIRVDGSAPRDVGTSMAVDDSGEIVGSISGGCVEGAVVEVAERVLATGRAEQAVFGVDDDTAFSVGLACGGDLHVLVRELDPREGAELERAREGLRAGSATVSRGPAELVGVDAFTVTDRQLAANGIHGITAARLHATARARLLEGATGPVPVQCEGAELEVFCESALEPPRMLLFGAVDFARALADAAALLGFAVTVCDARPAFATAARFPSARDVVVSWPDEYLDSVRLDERAVIVALTHDGQDVELLRRALALDVAFVGALGSRRTDARRRVALREAGVTEQQLARLHSPVGLDLGAATPEETAVSILAEVLAARAGAGARPLRDTDGAIHRR